MAILNIIFINIPWDVLRNIGAFIFVLGLLVLVHELGHFTVAKLNNIHVYQFCIGLGPKLIKFKGKETTYAICALPIGGMVDLREDDNDPENLRSFSAKTVATTTGHRSRGLYEFCTGHHSYCGYFLNHWFSKRFQ